MSIVEMFEKRPSKTKYYIIYATIVLALLIWGVAGIEYNGITEKGS